MHVNPSLANFQNLPSQFHQPALPFQSLVPFQMIMPNVNPMMLSPQMMLYNLQNAQQGLAALQSMTNSMPSAMLAGLVPNAMQYGRPIDDTSRWSFMPNAQMPVSQQHQQPAPSSYQLQSQSHLDVKSEPESEAEQDHRRTRGRPRGAKDKKPRKRRRTNEGSAADASAGGDSPPLLDHGLERRQRPLPSADGPGGSPSASPAADRSGRHKPWKIVLTKEDAEDIYRARATGKLAAAVCARLAEQHSVHAKVRARTTVPQARARNRPSARARARPPIPARRAQIPLPCDARAAPDAGPRRTNSRQMLAAVNSERAAQARARASIRRLAARGCGGNGCDSGGGKRRGRRWSPAAASGRRAHRACTSRVAAGRPAREPGHRLPQTMPGWAGPRGDRRIRSLRARARAIRPRWS
jgi:hypothetical protein